jgi:hypothetical protein
MEKEKIHVWDWQRLLFGEAPPLFLLESLGRSVFILLAFMVVGRMLGKRMNQQLTVTEMAVMVSLGAIIAPVMQLPDRGILMGLMVLGIALAFQRLLTRVDFSSERVEEVTQGKDVCLAADGMLRMDELRRSRISREQIFALLRSRGIWQLGQVERLYLEACGTFSLFRFTDPGPGLSIFPAGEFVSGNASSGSAQSECCSACGNCGAVSMRASHLDQPCTHCRGNSWVTAIH